MCWYRTRRHSSGVSGRKKSKDIGGRAKERQADAPSNGSTQKTMKNFEGRGKTPYLNEKREGKVRKTINSATDARKEKEERDGKTSIEAGVAIERGCAEEGKNSGKSPKPKWRAVRLRELAGNGETACWEVSGGKPAKKKVQERLAEIKVSDGRQVPGGIWETNHDKGMAQTVVQDTGDNPTSAGGEILKLLEMGFRGGTARILTGGRGGCWYAAGPGRTRTYGEEDWMSPETSGVFEIPSEGGDHK